MTSQAEIFAFLNAIEAVLTTNAAAITPSGMSTVTIYERDDKPFKIADGTMELPILYVIPMADGKDTFKVQQGGNSVLHEFQFSIMGYYEAAVADLNSAAGLTQRRNILTALFNTVDLFSGTGAYVYYTFATSKKGAGWISEGDCEMGYFDSMGNVVAGGIITIKAMLATNP
jgi:hypothetical protein